MTSIDPALERDPVARASADVHQHAVVPRILLPEISPDVVLSLGANADVLDALKEIEEMMPAIVPPGGRKFVKSLAFSWASASVRNQSTRLFGFRDGRSEQILPILGEHRRPRRNPLLEVLYVQVP